MIAADVCIIGAGPAGSSFARRMAEAGHDVVVIERSPFPRYQVGEGLAPGIWALLDALGTSERVAGAGFVCLTSTVVRWADGGPRTVAANPSLPPLVVDRGRFDAILLDAARAAGARVMQPATALRPVRTPSGWDVPVRTAEGGEQLVRARLLADAGGRSLAGGGTIARTSPRTLALTGTWLGERARPTQTWIEAGREGWLWAAPLPAGGVRVMAFVDRDLLARRGVRRPNLDALYTELLAGSACAEALIGARLADRVSARDATCYVDLEPVDETSIKLGEAALAVDPLSSSGVLAALQSGLTGSVVAHTLLSRPEHALAAIAFYRDHQHHTMDQHRSWARGYYGGHRLHAAEPYWRRRSSDPVEAPPEPPAVDLKPLLHRRVRLARDAALTPTPCAIGDHIELRPALTHPSLRRPVAYLGGVELAPLIECLQRGWTLEGVIEAWTCRMPRRRAVAVAAWLHTRGLLVDAQDAEAGVSLRLDSHAPAK